MARDDDLFSRMALQLEAFDSTDQALEAVAHYARGTLDADDAGVMLVRGNTVEVRTNRGNGSMRAAALLEVSLLSAGIDHVAQHAVRAFDIPR